jgi:hypothetical protein
MLTGFSLLFLSCGEKIYDVTIINNSSKTVSYVYDDEADVLEPGESKQYKVEAYTQPPRDISVNGEMNIIMIVNGDVFTFVDIEEENTEETD